MVYEGDRVGNVRHGEGEERHDGVLRYTGSFAHGCRFGWGTSYYSDGVTIEYEGMWRNNLVHGTCKRYARSGVVVYDGEWVRGMPHGMGVESSNDKSSYVMYSGNFVKGERSGGGVEFHPNGSTRYSGNWNNGLYDGGGSTLFENGFKEFAGSFRRGMRHGRGSLYDTEGLLRYVGDWESGDRHGSGTEFSAVGGDAVRRYHGGYARDRRQGSGKEFDAMGVLIYDGQFHGGLRHGVGFTTSPSSGRRKGVWEYGKFDRQRSRRVRLLDRIHRIQRTMRDAPVCHICLEILEMDKPSFVYVPCGHHVVCANCFTHCTWVSRCVVCRSDAALLRAQPLVDA